MNICILKTPPGCWGRIHMKDSAPVEIDGMTDLTVPYIPEHLYIAVFELLKNAQRATVPPPTFPQSGIKLSLMCSGVCRNPATSVVKSKTVRTGDFRPL